MATTHVPLKGGAYQSHSVTVAGLTYRIRLSPRRNVACFNEVQILLSGIPHHRCPHTMVSI